MGGRIEGLNLLIKLIELENNRKYVACSCCGVLDFAENGKLCRSCLRDKEEEPGAEAQAGAN
jgi:hypothetical protein